MKYINQGLLTAKEYKDIKKLHESQNLRDSMTNIEIALTNLGEATAVEFHRKNNSKGINELERPVVTSQNYIELTKNEKLVETK